MARLFETGFELNSLTNAYDVGASSGSVSISSTQARSGIYSLRCNGAVGKVSSQQFSSNQSNKQGYVGFAIYIVSLPDAATSIVQFINTTVIMQSAIAINTDATLSLINKNGTVNGSPSQALSLNAWYYVELAHNSNTSTVEARLNGVVFATGSNSGPGPWSGSAIGVITGTSAVHDMYFDDWKFNDTTGTHDTAYPGLANLLLVTPNGDGDSHQWLQTAGGAGSSTNYTLVKEIPPDGATSMVQSTTANDIDLYTVSSTGLNSNNTINHVNVFAISQNDTADATEALALVIEKTSGGTKALSSNIIPNLNSSFRRWPNAGTNTDIFINYTDPDAAAWTTSTLGSMQIGIKNTVDTANKLQVTGVYAYIEYVPYLKVYGFVG